MPTHDIAESAHLRIRPTMLSDLDFVVSVELKRIVLQTPGRGLGRACLRVLKKLAFRDLHAHRFWLDVMSLNARALRLYAGEGFVEEGRLRESVRLGSDDSAGWDSLVVMSLLDREYLARVDAALETPFSGYA